MFIQVDDDIMWQGRHCGSQSVEEVPIVYKKTMSITDLHLVDNRHAYIKSCKGPIKTWQIVSKMHEKKDLSNIIFIRYMSFMCNVNIYSGPPQRGVT